MKWTVSNQSRRCADDPSVHAVELKENGYAMAEVWGTTETQARRRAQQMADAMNAALPPKPVALDENIGSTTK